MRHLLAAVAILLTVPCVASAGAQVRVTIGPALSDKAADYGSRELDYLRDRLTEWVVQAAERTPTLDGARIDLVLIDAKPNHPTRRQLLDRPSLSMRSVSIGGATIRGEVVLSDGTRRPVDYRWYTDDITDVGAATTWTDADRTFSDFSRRLEHGRL